MDNPLVSVKYKIHEQIYLELKRRSAMRYVKRLLFFLAISVLVIGIAIPAGAEPKTKACDEVKDVSGEWTFDERKHDFTAREEYTLPDGCEPGSDADCTLVLGDYLSLTEMTGDIIALHMYLYSTYIYADGSMELVAIARVHGTAFGEEIDVWGKTTFDMFPNEAGTFQMKGSGRYMFPFRDCSPSVFLCYEGTYDGIDAEGTYEGVIIGSCK